MDLNNTVAVPEKLTQEERRKLKKAASGYGRLAFVESKSEVPRSTIYNAIAGRNIMPDNLNKIRAFLATHSQPAEK